MSRAAPLLARPIAHRGLHDAARGIIENTESAVRAAIAHGVAIEVDIQRTADDDAIVFHDDDLDRLTEGTGPLAALSVAALKRVALRMTADRMMTLRELCELVAGRVPLVVEIKSRFDGDLRLTARAASLLSAYRGPVALMSFDPAPIAALRAIAPDILRGIVAERRYAPDEWPGLRRRDRLALQWLTHLPRTRPDFLAYGVHDLPALPPLAARLFCGIPIMTWTVRSQADRARARRWADQMIFEGPVP